MSMQGQERRRSPRMRARLPVRIGAAPDQELAASLDLSAYGLSVLTERPRAEGAYLTVELALPDAEPRPLRATAVVVRAGRWEGPEGAVQGLALRFFRLSVGTHIRWCRCLRELEEAQAGRAGPVGPVGQAGGGSPRPSYLIQPPDLDRLRRFAAEELRVGRVRLFSPEPERVGATLQLLLIHPLSEQEWALAAVVCGRKMVDGGAELELLLSPLGASEQAQLERFVEDGQPPILDLPPVLTAPETDQARSPAAEVAALLRDPRVDLDGVELLAQRAIQAHPGAPHGYLARAQLRCRQGRYQEAEADLLAANQRGAAHAPAALIQLVRLGRAAEPLA